MHALSLNLSFPLAREFHDGAHGTEFTFAGRIPASPSVMLPSHVRNCAGARSAAHSGRDHVSACSAHSKHVSESLLAGFGNRTRIGLFRVRSHQHAGGTLQGRHVKSARVCILLQQIRR